MYMPPLTFIARMAAAISSGFSSWRRAFTATPAPFHASATAIARPISRLAPVASANTSVRIIHDVISSPGLS
jgi:hypothetical protein